MRAGTPQLQLLDEAQMRSLVPVLEPQFAQLGLFEPGAADIDVNALHQGFIRGLKQRGSRLECGVQIHSIERSRRRVVARGRHARRAAAYPAGAPAHRRRGRMGR